MQARSLLRLPLFRLALLYSSLFALSTLLLFAFIYWQTAVVETERVDSQLLHDAQFLASLKPEALRDVIDNRVMPDFRRVAHAGLFAADGARLAGNLPSVPSAMSFDGKIHRTDVPDAHLTIRAVGLALPDGTRLLIGRNVESLDNLQLVVVHALELGLVPAILLALGAGAVAGQRTRRQLQSVHETAERIMKGDLRERLPTHGGGDDLDRLAVSVNLMLDEIARLMDDMKSVGDNIAHDLRTPLTRVRARLERARDSASTTEEWHQMVDRAVAGLDQALRLITALLRISEIEGGRRRAAFESVSLGRIAEEIAELYEPFAEEQGVRFALDLAPVRAISGDRDLLSELISNLVANAIKFTPAGGSVRLSLADGAEGPVLQVADTGPGIALEQRELVFKRFYRSDASRSIEGYGLGLSLVDAIAKLHGFRVTIDDNRPGSVFILWCGKTRVAVP
jgi:signal transduction histidine kinase